MFSFKNLIFALPVVLMGAEYVQAAETARPVIQWRVENPFRLFRHADDFQKLKIPSGSSIEQWFTTIAPRIGGDFLPYRRTKWDPVGGVNTTGQYEQAYFFPNNHRIILSMSNTDTGAQCVWTVAGQTFAPSACLGFAASVPYNYRAPSATSVKVEVHLPEKNAVITTYSTSVTIQDKLIVGFGDSYSAGEGSPDRPAELTVYDSKQIHNAFEKPAGNYANVWFPVLKTGRAAEWWDKECHRSLLSWQVLAALKLASELSQREERENSSIKTVISFGSYACSGAEFYDGLLTRQSSPPGGTKLGSEEQTHVQHSQIYAAAKDLCEFGFADTQMHGIRQVELWRCQHPRRPDAILASIGGNDAGFAKVIMHNLIPTSDLGNNRLGAVGLKLVHAVTGTVSPARAKKRIESMAPLYKRFDDTLNSVLAPGDSPLPVMMMVYPNPLFRPGSKLDYCGLESRAGMEAAIQRAFVAKPWWHVWSTRKESQETSQDMIVPLQMRIRESAPSHWLLIRDHLAAFREHGVCADATKMEDDSQKNSLQADPENVRIYGLPRYEVAPPVLKPMGALTWRAYEPARRRWVRTPNDSVQTQTGTTLAESMSGTFHPTGAGYARIADAAYECLVLVIAGAETNECNRPRRELFLDEPKDGDVHSNDGKTVDSGKSQNNLGGGLVSER